MGKQMTAAELKAKRKNLRFDDLCKVIESIGYTLDRVTGSHHIFTRPNSPGIVVQPDRNGMAKGYQVKQVAAIMELGEG